LKDETVTGTHNIRVEISAGSKRQDIIGLKLVITECGEDTISSTVTTVTSQTVLIDVTDLKFKIAAYAQTDSQCPPVDKVVIGNADCTGNHADFKDAANIIDTLSDGFYYAQLTDEKTVAGTSDFCVEYYAGTKSK